MFAAPEPSRSTNGMDWLKLLEEIENYHKKLTYFKLIKYFFDHASTFKQIELIFYLFVACGYAAAMFYSDKNVYFVYLAIFWSIFIRSFQKMIENNFIKPKNKSTYMWQTYSLKYIKYSKFKVYLDQKKQNKNILKNIHNFLEKEKLYTSFNFAILNHPIMGTLLTITLSIIVAIFVNTTKGKVIIGTIGFIGTLFLIIFLPSLIVLKIHNKRYIELMQFLNWYLKGIQ